MPKRNYGKIKANAGWEKLQAAEPSRAPPPAEEPGWDHSTGHVECCHELGDGVVVLREWVSRLIIRSVQPPHWEERGKGASVGHP